MIQISRRSFFGLIGAIVAACLAVGMFASAANADGDKKVSSRHKWQNSGAGYVRAGDTVTISVAGGSWTVDYRNYHKVGPEGYTDWYINNRIDESVRDGHCRITGDPYGALLYRIGNGSPLLVGNGTSIIADRSGKLQFRINDGDRCLNDNRGSIRVTTSISRYSNGGYNDGGNRYDCSNDCSHNRGRHHDNGRRHDGDSSHS